MRVDANKRRKQVEMVEAVEGSGFNGIVLAPTGIGKAWVLIECLKRLKPKGRIWYLCDSELNRDETFKKQLNEWGAKRWLDKIEFMCYQSAYKLENEDVELALLDEFDYALTKEYGKTFFKNSFKHLVAVSATLTDDKRKFAESIRPIVYEVGLQDVEDEGLLNKTRYHFVNFMLTTKENDQYLNFSRKFANLLVDGKKNKWRLDFLKIQRGQFLANLESSKLVCRKLVKQLYEDPESRIVIFCGLTSQAEKVCEYAYHSKSTYNYLKDFDEGTIRLVSVVGKINRGVNINRINRIVFESPTRSSTKFSQRSGRGRRLGVDEVLDVYFLIPYFKNSRGTILPTIVKKYVTESTKAIEYSPIIYKF